MFRASESKIKDIMFDDSLSLSIPKYQRPYTWTKDETDEFWEDITNNDSIFLGTLILNSGQLDKNNHFEVVDGQQRLITITTFLAVLRDYAKTMGYSELASRIQRKTIVSEDISGKTKERLIVGESLKNFFVKFIQSDRESPNLNFSSKEEKLLCDNYELFSERLRFFLIDTPKDEVEEKIQSLVNRIFDIDCVAIYVTGDEDAYAIFETVNARGVDLSVADLLKNFLFKELESSGNVKVGQEKWNKLVANIQEADIELQKFLRYFWLSKYAFVSERELYKAIKTEHLNPEQLLEDLISSSDIYLKIASNNEDDWDDYEHANSIRRALKGLSVMGASQCHVLFLSVLRHKEVLGASVKRIFSAVEKFTFLYSAVSKLPANRVEKIYSRYAIKLERESNSKDLKNRSKNIQKLVEEFIKELQQLKPAEPLFAEKFSEVEYKNSEKGRKLISYILSGIESLETKSEMSINFDVVNIEHIIPQKPSKDWHITKKDIKDYVNLLGNLVLIHKEYNSKAGNKSLSEKCGILKDTKISTTKRLIESIVDSGYVWDERTIKDRQEKLCDLAYHMGTF